MYGEGATDGVGSAEAGKEFGVVGFNFLSCTPAVPPLASRQFGVDEAGVDGEACGEADDGGEHGGAMRFARGLKVEF